MSKPIVHVKCNEKLYENKVYVVKVTCPTCGEVNKHGLGDDSYNLIWGHRVCSGRGCLGYELQGRNEDPTFADAYRALRRQKQARNLTKANESAEFLDIYRVQYSENNNVISIIHPHTQKKIRRSLVNAKTYYNKEWRTDISLWDIVQWFREPNFIFEHER
tara:strand:+ start:3339 stop:3821 length:483 start_codon:yes stop_codon:yes gene_type:complete